VYVKESETPGEYVIYKSTYRWNDKTKSFERTGVYSFNLFKDEIYNLIEQIKIKEELKRASEVQK
jgi:hypothetical protein